MDLPDVHTMSISNPWKGVVARMLTADAPLRDDANISLEELVNAFADYLSILLDEKRLLPLELVVSQTPEDREYAATRFQYYLVSACQSRSFFKMSKGWGLGPRITQSGDIVAVIYGSEWPWVLRPHGEEYQLVGPCYVYGIMDGEAVIEHQKLGKADAMFRII